MNGNKHYKLPGLLANGTIGPFPGSPYNVALFYGDYYFTQAIVHLAKLRQYKKLHFVIILS